VAISVLPPTADMSMNDSLRERRAFASHLLGHGLIYDGDILASI
jgi:hypothetical protein